MYREIIAVCSQIHTKHTNALCRHNVELLNVKPYGTFNNHWALKTLNTSLTNTFQRAAFILLGTDHDCATVRSLTPQAVFLRSHLASLAREGAKMEAGRWLPAHLTLLVHLQTQRGQLSSLVVL